MPSLSRAQFRKIEDLYREGKITKKQRDNFNGGVVYSKLPERQPSRKRDSRARLGRGKKRGR